MKKITLEIKVKDCIKYYRNLGKHTDSDISRICQCSRQYVHQVVTGYDSPSHKKGVCITPVLDTTIESSKINIEDIIKNKNMSYKFELKIFGGEDGEIEIGKVEAFTIESLEEQLRKASALIQKHESDQEAMAQYEIERQKEEEEVATPSGL
jgi:hypothetical protein